MNSRYLCLVYEDEEKSDALTDDEIAAIAREERDSLGEMQMRGDCVASARMSPAATVASVRVHDGATSVSDESVARREQLRGFHLIAARDLNDAIRIVAKLPRTRLGRIDVWPLAECDPG